MSKKPANLDGQTFNDLTVIEMTEQRNSYGYLLYRCRCNLCGGERLATASNLKRGEVKNCGCTKHNPHKSLVGQTFGNMYVKDTTVVNNKLQYVCICTLCGNEKLASPNGLRNGTIKSCGNHNKGAEAKLKKLFIDNTAPCKIRDTSKLRSTNTSGVTGVYWDKQKCMWSAEIVFQNVRHHLGRYGRKEDAIAARQKAEKEYFQTYLKTLEESTES